MADQPHETPRPEEANDETTKPIDGQRRCHIDFAAAEAALPTLVLVPNEAPPQKPSFDLEAATAALPPLLTPGQRPRSPRLDTLGHDILSCILRYISRQKHMLACLRTNRQISRIIFPCLYKNLGITVNSKTHSQNASLLVEAHSGLRHIKNLWIYGLASGEVPASAHKFLEALLGKLQDGQLSYLYWDCDFIMPLDLLQYAWRTQPNITRIQLGGLKETAVGSMHVTLVEQLDTTAFSRLMTLELTPYKADDALAGSKALAKFQSISKLHVNGLHWSEGDPLRDDEDADDGNENEAEVHDKLTAALFDHRPKSIPQTLKTKWTGVTSLWISDINMRYCRYTWFEHLDFVNLASLHIQYCPHADVFLTQLMRTEPLQLEDFILLHTIQRNSPDRIVTELEEFLNMTKGRLHTLDLWLRDLPDETMLKVAIINRHRATLERLSIDVMSHTGTRQISAHRYTATAMGKLLKGCDRLSQLAIALPAVTWKYPTDQFHKVNKEFSEVLDVILSNVNLTTLCITNLPLSFGVGLDAAYQCSIQPQWERIATDIFNHTITSGSKNGHKTRELDILAFGTRWRTATLPLPKYYIGCKISCLHRHIRKAQQVSLRHLRSEDMDVDILYYPWRHFDKEYRKKWIDWDHYVHDEVKRAKDIDWIDADGDSDATDIDGTLDRDAFRQMRLQVKVELPGMGTWSGADVINDNDNGDGDGDADD